MLRNLQVRCLCTSVRNFHGVKLEGFETSSNIRWPEDGIGCNSKNCSCSLSSMPSRSMRYNRDNIHRHLIDRFSDDIEHNYSSIVPVHSVVLEKHLMRFEKTRRVNSGFVNQSALTEEVDCSDIDSELPNSS